MSPMFSDDELAMMNGGGAKPAAAPAAPAGGNVLSASDMAAMGGATPSPSGAMAGSALSQVVNTPQDGFSPEGAIPTSPLSIAQRAMLGWARTPEEQIKSLIQMKQFDDVKPVQTDDGMHIAVQKDGQWMQADPSFHFKNLMSMNTLGSAAQEAGEYGLRTIGAVHGAVVGGEAGAVVGGPFGALAGGIIGAGVGAMGVEGADLASRASLMDPSAPGARPYDLSQVPAQLGTSFIYGAMQEMGNKISGYALNKAGDVWAQALKYMGGSSSGQVAARKVMQTLPGGESDAVAFATLKNPDETLNYINLAKKDMIEGSHIRIGATQDALMDQVSDSIQSVRAKQGGEFAALRADPDVKKAVFDVADGTPSEGKFGINDAISFFRQPDINFLNQNGRIIAEDGLLTDADKQAINYITSKQPMSTGLSYDDARLMNSNLSGYLDVATNNKVRLALTSLKDGMHDAIIDGLPDEAAVRYGNVVSKYADINQVAEELSKFNTTAAKRDNFMNKLASGADNSGSAMKDALVKAGVPSELMDSMLRTKMAQAQAAIHASPLDFLKKVPFFPNGAKVQMALANSPIPSTVNAIAAASSKISAAMPSALQSASAAATTPYIAKTFSTLQKMDPQQRSSFLNNPQAIDASSQLIQQAAAGEGAQAQRFMQQAAQPNGPAAAGAGAPR